MKSNQKKEKMVYPGSNHNFIYLHFYLNSDSVLSAQKGKKNERKDSS